VLLRASSNGVWTESGDCDDAVAEIDASDIHVKVRDRRNAYTNALKVKVLDDVRAGLSITEAARIHGTKSWTAGHGWTKMEAKIREACDNKKRSNCRVDGQGRVNLFPYCDELVQWIKQMRRDDFPLKTCHVLVFMKEEYGDFMDAYLSENKEESLGRMMRQIIHKNGFSFRRPTKSFLSSQDLEAEQRKFSSAVGIQVNAAYARSCIFNADETTVLYDDTPTRISERGAKKGVKIKGRTRSERASVLLISSAGGQKLRPHHFQGTAWRYSGEGGERHLNQGSYSGANQCASMERSLRGGGVGWLHRQGAAWTARSLRR
jgi:hypothetical protein